MASVHEKEQYFWAGVAFGAKSARDDGPLRLCIPLHPIPHSRQAH